MYVVLLNVIESRRHHHVNNGKTRLRWERATAGSETRPVIKRENATMNVAWEGFSWPLSAALE
jgi:hypothetical protein